MQPTSKTSSNHSPAASSLSAPRLSARLFVVLLTLVTSGCSGEWDRQVAEVRAGRSQRIEIADETIDDAQLRGIADLSELRELILDETNLSPRAVDLLADLPQLEHVRLRGARVGDEQLARLARLPHLRVLNLPQADFSDAGLAVLASCAELELLRFGSPRVTDQGMAAIAAAPALKYLHLIDVPVTDEGLAPLRDAMQLQSLYLDGTLVTDDGVERLIKDRPRLHLHVDQRHSDRDDQAHDHAH